MSNVIAAVEYAWLSIKFWFEDKKFEFQEWKKRKGNK